MGHTNTYLANEATSQISVKSIQGKSTLTEAKILRPLKIFSLQNDTALQVIFSNYGGGFVEGDHIKIDLSCNEETKTAFTSQAHTRVYRSERAMPSRQEIHAKLGKGCFCYILM
jgi:urease accessory protein